MREDRRHELARHDVQHLAYMHRRCGLRVRFRVRVRVRVRDERPRIHRSPRTYKLR